MPKNDRCPAIRADLDKLRHNAETLAARAKARGVELAGVVKCCCGSPEVARAFLAGGVAQIADSRIRNLRKLRENGIAAPLWLLRLPMPGEVEDTVRYATLSLNSSPELLEQLSRAAVAAGRIHQVLLMVDLGDRREGVQPGELIDLYDCAAALPGLYVAGIGTNLTCYGGVVPDASNMGFLAELAEKLERDRHRTLPYVSAGNSSAVAMMLEGKLPPRLNHLRCGEALLLGRETRDGTAIPGLYGDAFTLTAEVIECAVKPSRPAGEIRLDAFGKKPQIVDRGLRRRLILGIGREDLPPEGLTPRQPGIRILGASSDHLIADADDTPRRFHPGDRLDFDLSYTALLAGMTSPYVEKSYFDAHDAAPEFSGMALIAAPFAADPRYRRFCRTPEAMPPDSLPTAPAEVIGCGDAAAIAPAVRRALARHLRPLVLGGSHQVAAELARGLVEDIPGCGWIVFSAFGDFNTPAGGGSTEGMTLAAINGRPEVPTRLETPIPESRTVLIGLRSIDPEERRRLRESGIRIFTMEEIDRYGMAEITARTLAHLNDAPAVAVDFSMSALDPAFAPGDPPAPPCGMTLREAFCSLEMIADSRRLAGAALTEAGDDPAALRNAAALIGALFGHKILR